MILEVYAMARLPRYVVPGLPQHVIQRGNNRQAIFAGESDYVAYLAWLKEAAQRYGLLIHAYVLMTNHVHLLVTPTQVDSIAKTLQSLGRRYCSVFQLYLWPHRDSMGRALPCDGGGCRGLPAGMLSIHRDEPRPGGSCQILRPLSMVELPS